MLVYVIYIMKSIVGLLIWANIDTQKPKYNPISCWNLINVIPIPSLLAGLCVSQAHSIAT